MSMDNLGMYFDKQGKMIPAGVWSAAIANVRYSRVDLTYLNGFKISTTWLGLNHNFGGFGPPLIFETMIFETGPLHCDELGLSENQWRYATLEDAQEGHTAAVKIVARLLASLPTQRQAVRSAAMSKNGRCIRFKGEG